MKAGLSCEQAQQMAAFLYAKSGSRGENSTSVSWLSGEELNMLTRADNSRLRLLAQKSGWPVTEIILRLMQERAASGGPRGTLLAVCPNSEAVLRAAIRAARAWNSPMCFAATLNQVDLDGGYTGYRPNSLIGAIRKEVEEVGFQGPVIVGLDHGGPWLRDKHSSEGWNLQRTMTAVKASMRACLEAGYDLLHVDPTVDRSLPPGEAVPIHTVVDRTLEIISYVECLRREQDYPAISYEVGTEEVHGGLANLHSFVSFLLGIRDGLRERGLSDVWPVLVVGKVGTDLHTTQFDPSVARNLAEIAGAFGSLIKGHYTDYVSNPQEYPRVGMGGANVGPEFTQVEYEALLELYGRETQTGATEPSRMMEELRNAVIGSNRWRKWLSDAEQGLAFDALDHARQAWLIRTGSRYVWADERVRCARQKLYLNLHHAGVDGENFVLERIVNAIGKYLRAFNLVDFNDFVVKRAPEIVTLERGLRIQPI